MHVTDTDCAVQMYLNNNYACQFPDWANTRPDYTFLVPMLNATTMPDLWSHNVSQPSGPNSYTLSWAFVPFKGAVACLSSAQCPAPEAIELIHF